MELNEDAQLCEMMLKVYYFFPVFSQKCLFHNFRGGIIHYIRKLLLLVLQKTTTHFIRKVVAVI